MHDEPARFGLLLIGLIALAAFLLIVARTGNDSGVGASGPEMKLRALMDHIFPARPRTKEFLLGHPAFVLAIAWWWRGRRRLAIPAFVVGSIGQASLLNTFCHIHTPLIISLWHGIGGLVLGVGVGVGLFLLGESCCRLRQRMRWGVRKIEFYASPFRATTAAVTRGMRRYWQAWRLRFGGRRGSTFG